MESTYRFCGRANFRLQGPLPSHSLSPQQLAQTKSFRQRHLVGLDLPRSSLDGQTDLSHFQLRNTRFRPGDDYTDLTLTNASIAGCEFYGIWDFSQFQETNEVKKGGLPVRMQLQHGGDLSGLDLDKAHLSLPPGVPIDLSDCKIDNCTLVLPERDLRGVIESTWSYQQRRLLSFSLSLAGGQIGGISFDGMIISNCVFADVDLSQATFHDAAISDSLFQNKGTHSLSLEQLRQTFNAKHGHLKEFRQLPDDLLRQLTLDSAD